jgi:chemotaxis response regulator CheB
MALPIRLAEVLGWRTNLRVKFAEAGERPQPGTVYVAPADAHLIVGPGRAFQLVNGCKIRHLRSSANPLFESAADSLKGRVIAVVLTGGDRDATDGVQSVKGAGGRVIAQSPRPAKTLRCRAPRLPGAAWTAFCPWRRIGLAVVELVQPAGVALSEVAKTVA